ncbi:MAG: ATP-dependent DNA helicase RecG, partial [Actinobacteria bacterium]|nr:ATP-dependent DNA helicase RecG [Actinomycetota bacterium]
MADLATPLPEILGAKTAQLLTNEFGMHTIEDLLRHYPRRYEQRGALTNLNELSIGEHVTVQAEVVSFRSVRNQSKPGNRQEVVI